MIKRLYTQNLVEDLFSKIRLPRKDIIKAITFIFQIITHYAFKNYYINITEFGKFNLSLRKSKKTTHPITYSSYTIPERKILKCKFSQSFINYFNKKI